MSFFTWLYVTRIVSLIATNITFMKNLTLSVLFVMINVLLLIRIMTLSRDSHFLTLRWHLSNVWSYSNISRVGWFVSRRFVELTTLINIYLWRMAWEAEDTLSSYLACLGSLVTACDWKITSGAAFLTKTKDWKNVICADLSGHFSRGSVYYTFYWGYLLQGLKVTFPAGMTPFADAIWTKILTLIS